MSERARGRRDAHSGPLRAFDGCATLGDGLHAGLGDEIRDVAQHFSDELADSCELVQGLGRGPVGFVTFGQGHAFFERVARVARGFGAEPASIEAGRALVARLGHQRLFTKCEWHPDAMGSIQPLTGIAVRGRPELAAVLDACVDIGMRRADLEVFERLARLLGKDTAHFVAVAFPAGSAPYVKLYFTQFVSASTAPAIAARLEAALAAFCIHPEALSAWRRHHDVLAEPYREATVFVSTTLGHDGPQPTLKIDYADVSALRAAGLLPPSEQAVVQRQAEALCRLTAQPVLTHLGVRLGPTPKLCLKAYSELPTPGALQAGGAGAP